jgi:hypothetical protein
MKNSEEKFRWMAYGVMLLLIIKYVVVGLYYWNRFLHPNRVEDKTTMFYCPLLGIFGGCETHADTTISYGDEIIGGSSS